MDGLYCKIDLEVSIEPVIDEKIEISTEDDE
jgi:hypothetical protein